MSNTLLFIRNLLKNRMVLIIGAGVFLLTASLTVASRRASEARAAATGDRVGQHPSLIAGPGRVEPISEDIKIGSELSGKLKAVYVEEGDHIVRGQLLAELQNDDYRAQIASAEAQVVAK